MSVRVLVVDDTKNVADGMAKMLRSPDIETEAVYSGEECLERLKREPKIDLIILDMSMPGMNGTQVITEIKKWMANPSFKILISTAYADWGEFVSDLPIAGAKFGAPQKSDKTFGGLVIGDIDRARGALGMLEDIKGHIAKLKSQ